MNFEMSWEGSGDLDDSSGYDANSSGRLVTVRVSLDCCNEFSLYLLDLIRQFIKDEGIWGEWRFVLDKMPFYCM